MPSLTSGGMIPDATKERTFLACRKPAKYCGPSRVAFGRHGPRAAISIVDSRTPRCEFGNKKCRASYKPARLRHGRSTIESYVTKGKLQMRKSRMRQLRTGLMEMKSEQVRF